MTAPRPELVEMAEKFVGLLHGKPPAMVDRRAQVAHLVTLLRSAVEGERDKRNTAILQVAGAANCHSQYETGCAGCRVYQAVLEECDHPGEREFARLPPWLSVDVEGDESCAMVSIYTADGALHIYLTADPEEASAWQNHRVGPVHGSLTMKIAAALRSTGAGKG